MARRFITVRELTAQSTPTPHNTKRAEDFHNEIYKVFTEGEQDGSSIHIPVLHEHLRWRKGFVYCFTGYPGAGKSEFINYLCVLHAKETGAKIAMFTPENYPAENQVINLMRSYLGKNVSKGYNNICTVKEWEAAKQFVHKHFFLIEFGDVPQLNELLYEYEILHETEGVGMFVTDPFNAVAEGSIGDGNISKYLKVGLTQMKIFAQQNKVINVIIEHPSKPLLNKDGSLPEVNPWMLYGGSMWWNKMDVIVSISREDNITKIRVCKVKLQRLNGVPGEKELRYETESGRFMEL